MKKRVVDGVKRLSGKSPLVYRFVIGLYHALNYGLIDLFWFIFLYFKEMTGDSRCGKGRESRESRPVISMLAISDLKHDPRVERAAKTLANRGYSVRILCPGLGDQGRETLDIDWGKGISFRILPATFGSYNYRLPYVFGLKFFRAAEEEKPFAYHCHDLSTSVVGLAAASRSGAYCICDFHEWYSENASWDQFKKRFVAHPRHKKALYRAGEKLVMDKATAVITVCDSIAESLERSHNKRRHVHVIRNIPFIEDMKEAGGSDLREITGVGKEIFVLLYQGGVGPSRYLEPVIRAMAQVRDAIFVIRGPGMETYRKDYDNLAKSLGIGDRIFCLDPVPSQRVVAEAASADAGIWTLKNICKNFEFALPNKVFEYLTAGLPVLVADYPEVRKLVRTYDVGLCFDPDSPSSIADAINSMAGDADLRRRCRGNIRAALNANQPELEWEKLVALYNELHGKQRGMSISHTPVKVGDRK